uniref:VWFA domain-containing protein n=1 Tax=Arcella intermedia TaxID=1963864 RepID=A0A6B2KZ96_9EUKA
MSDDAKFQDPENENNTISEGLSTLDLVKHAVKTVICTLTDNDRLSVVVFDDVGATPFPLHQMDDAGKKQAIAAVEALGTRGCTNIWAGLLTGMESLRAPPQGLQPEKSRKNTVILLTDGQPNQAPSEGEVRALQQYLEKHPEFKCQVNTFGFGYNLNSRLLHDLAFTGSGTFSFIPDAKILGTCFVNAVANICSNLTQKCKVHLLLQNGAKFSGEVDGKYPVSDVSGGRVVHIGPLQYGQDRDISVPLELPAKDGPYLEIIVEIEKSNGATHKTTFLASNRTPTPTAAAAVLRNHVVGQVSYIVEQWEKGEKSVKPMDDLVAKLANCEAASAFSENADSRLVALNDDVSGRVCKSVSTVERFNRWGKHYLLALNRSHQLQMRTNFMDPGLQIYGGLVFRKLEEEGGKIFVSLPMKKRENYQANAPVAPSTTTNTTYYGGGGGGCFDALSTVKVLKVCAESNLLEEVEVELGEVRRNDLVRVVDERGEVAFARVLCVVKIEIDAKAQREMVQLEGGLIITKNHPIRRNGVWGLPKQVPGAVTVRSSTAHVYNFVLEHSHVLLVNGVECCTFGHQLQDPVAWHPFYATEQVINTLATLPGWENGAVAVNGSIRKLAYTLSTSCLPISNTFTQTTQLIQ